MSVQSVGLWRSKHWFMPVAMLAGLIVLLFIGLVLHELGIMPWPMNGWYEQLHEAISGQPMARWMW